MVRGTQLIDLAGSIEAETERTYRFFDGTKFVWLPKSQCEWDEGEQMMTMPEWLAIEKELI